MQLPPLEELFPFEYQGGGYFRLKGVPKNTPAKIVHGEEAIKLLYDNIQEQLNWIKLSNETDTCNSTNIRA